MNLLSLPQITVLMGKPQGLKDIPDKSDAERQVVKDSIDNGELSQFSISC
jgi:hypothetical protein